jgi:hypothetical protein
MVSLAIPSEFGSGGEARLCSTRLSRLHYARLLVLLRLNALSPSSASLYETSLTDSGSIFERIVNPPPWINLSAALSALFDNFLVHFAQPR